MTNAEIIMRESLELAEQGILATTEATFTDENGEEVTLNVPEEIHTFDQWKKSGRIVKYGEHAIAKFAVWSPTKKTQKMLDENDGKVDEKKKSELKMYMRNACWFKKSQTQTIEEAERDREARQEAKKAEAKPEQPEAKKAETKKSSPKKSAPKSEAKNTKSAKPKKTEKSELVTLRNALEKATLKKNPDRYLLLERHGEYVDICDTGAWLAEVSNKGYEEVFVNGKKSSVFPSLRDGECLKINDKTSGNTYNSPMLDDLLTDGYGFNMKEEDLKPVEVLDYTEKQESGKTLHALKCGNKIKAVNDAYLTAFDKNTKWFSTENRVTPIVSEHGAIMLVRVGDDFAERATAK